MSDSPEKKSPSSDAEATAAAPLPKSADSGPRPSGASASEHEHEKVQVSFEADHKLDSATVKNDFNVGAGVGPSPNSSNATSAHFSRRGDVSSGAPSHKNVSQFRADQGPGSSSASSSYYNQQQPPYYQPQVSHLVQYHPASQAPLPYAGPGAGLGAAQSPMSTHLHLSHGSTPSRNTREKMDMNLTKNMGTSNMNMMHTTPMSLHQSGDRHHEHPSDVNPSRGGGQNDNAAAALVSGPGGRPTVRTNTNTNPLDKNEASPAANVNAGAASTQHTAMVSGMVEATPSKSESEHLPRRVLQFEPSPNSAVAASGTASTSANVYAASNTNPNTQLENKNITAGGRVGADATSRTVSASGNASPGKMDPLDGNHRLNLPSSTSAASGAKGGTTSSSNHNHGNPAPRPASGSGTRPRSGSVGEHGHGKGPNQNPGLVQSHGQPPPHSQYHPHPPPSHGYPPPPGGQPPSHHSSNNPHGPSHGHGPHSGYPPPPPLHHHPSAAHGHPHHHGHGHPQHPHSGHPPYPPPPHYGYNYGHGHGHAVQGHPSHPHHGHHGHPPPPPQAPYEYYNPNSGPAPPPPSHHHPQHPPHSHSHHRPPSHHPPPSSSSYPSPSPSHLKTSMHSPDPVSGSSGSGNSGHSSGGSSGMGNINSSVVQTPSQRHSESGSGSGSGSRKSNRYDPYAASSSANPSTSYKDESQHQHPTFQPTPTFDRMPLMDIQGNSDSKNFDDLMVSPSTGLSNYVGSDKRRVPYDLQDQPVFNEQHNSPIAIRRNTNNASATRYCTPIVTGGNDRSRVTSASSFNLLNSGPSEQNYRPSPPQGGRHDDFDSHMQYYHRPYPTMRGGQSSPTRYDDKTASSKSQGLSSSDHRYGSSSHGHGSSPIYATPVFPRGGAPAPSSKETTSGSIRNSLGSSSSGGHSTHGSHPNYPTPTTYYEHHSHGSGMSSYPPHAPHSNPPAPYPRHDGPYPPPHTSYMGSGTSPYGTHPPPPYPAQGYPSPYDAPGYSNPHVGHMPYPHDYRSAVEKKRRRTEPGGRKAPKPPKRKKMYSDFVGVTYNKTHAKFQACITHYRKQHYLGRYKLACDAAKAYDQSAKLLKGNGWKINFQNEEEYHSAKEKELREVEEKRQGSGIDVNTLRKSYEASFPTEAALREKLGLQPKPPQQHVMSHTSPSMVMSMQQGGSAGVAAYSSTMHTQGEYKHRDMIQQHQQHSGGGAGSKAATTAQTPAPGSASSAAGQPASTNAGTTTSDKVQGQPAVTPSPNLTNLNKSTTLMKEPLMSPAFASGASPSANSLLGGGTPFTMPESTMKFHSAAKPTSDNKRDLDMISSNIFQSPKEKMSLSSSTAPLEAVATPTETEHTSARQKESREAETKQSGSEKGKGDLAAASALLTIARPN